MSGPTKTNLEHRFEKNDKLTRNKSSKIKKVKLGATILLELIPLLPNLFQDKEELGESRNSETPRREKSSFKINRSSKGDVMI